MKIKEQRKQGISLIVLVITIIVMIILATTVIISLTNNGIIGKANEAVNDSNLKQIETIASLAWSDAYMDGVRSTKGLEAAVKNKLKEVGIEENEYELNVTENGVDLEVATTPIYFGKPYSVNQGGNVISYVIYKDGSAEYYMNKVLADSSPKGTLEYNGGEIYMNGQLFVTLPEDGKQFEYMGMVFQLDTTWCVHSNVDIINETPTYDGDAYCYECGEIITSLEHNGVIPEGGTYYVGVTSTATGDYTGGTAYTSGQNFPATVSDGDVYVYGDYEYRYNYSWLDSWQENRIYELALGLSLENGWSVRVLNDTKIKYGVVINEINNESVTNMNFTFRACTRLIDIENLLIPKGISTMLGTFWGCSTITKVSSMTIPNSVTNISYYTFSECINLTSIIVPNSVTSIGYGAFEKCSGLTSVIIQNSVTSIGERAFKECNGLISVTIPNSVTSIGKETFRDCSELTTINYTGTIEQWQTIEKESLWDYNSGNYTIYCTNGRIAKDGTVTRN